MPPGQRYLGDRSVGSSAASGAWRASWARNSSSSYRRSMRLSEEGMSTRADTHSKLIGYLLWIVGFTGAHRFYFGRPVSGTIWGARRAVSH